VTEQYPPNPYQQQPQPQPQYMWQPPPPQKQGFSAAVFWVAVVAAFVVGIGLGVVVAVAADDKDDEVAVEANNDEDVKIADDATADPPDATSSATPPPTPSQEPVEAQPVPVDGQVFDGWQLIGALDLHDDSLNDFEARFRATNVTEGSLVAAFDMTVLKGDEIMAVLSCGDYNDVPSGRTTTFECTTMDDFKTGWTSIELEYSGY
jgi:hypothetical protein